MRAGTKFLGARWLASAALGLGAVTVALSGAALAQDSSEDYWVDDGSSDERRSRTTTTSGEGGSLRLGQVAPREIPSTHVVETGDTLWNLSGRFYGSPWEWPRVWSYNPEITNPHWIYPQQVLRLLPAGAPTTVVTAGGPASARRSRLVVRRGVPDGTVFLQEQGWLDRDAVESAGVIVGSPDDHMLLSPYDAAYIRFDHLPEGQEPQGEHVIFRQFDASQRMPREQGTLVRILGAVRIDSWDAERHTARATIVEARDPIERGYQVAAIPRRFDAVPPQPASVDIDTEIVATLEPTTLVGDRQIVFVPVGDSDQVAMGNRFTIVRIGDAWRQDLQPAQRESTSVDLPAQPERYPAEAVAEAIVVSVRPHSAGLLVTRTTSPLEVGDRAQLRAGY